MKMQWAMKLPEAWRLLRAGLKKDKSLGYMLLSIVICALIVVFVIVNNTDTYENTFDRGKAIAEYILGICLYLSVLWLVFVPMSVGGALAQEFSINTWVFQQTAPQSARRLLLGKILGAPANIYVATLGTLPFIIAIFLFYPSITLPLLFSLLFIVICSFSLSCMFLYISCSIPVGHHNMTVPGLTIIAAIILLSTSVIPFEIMNEYGYEGSSAQIHPAAVFDEIIRFTSYEDANNYYKKDKSFAMYFAEDSKAINPPSIRKSIKVRNKPPRFYYVGEYFPAPYINFFGVFFGVIPYNIVFHFLLGICLFFAAEGALLRKFGTGQSRIPQLIPLTLMIVIIYGFTFDMPVSEYREWPLGEGLPLIASLFWAVFCVCAIQHARSMEDLRPWLYDFSNGRRYFADYFHDDAPVIYTTLLLLPFALFGFTLIMLNYKSPPIDNENPMTNIHIAAYVAMFGVIVLRDTLLFQLFRLKYNKSDLRFVLFYGVVFVGITLIAFVASLGAPVLDLTPFSALFPMSFPEYYEENDFAFVYIYLAVNGLLALLFGAIVQRHLKKKRKSFRIEDEILSAA